MASTGWGGLLGGPQQSAEAGELGSEGATGKADIHQLSLGRLATPTSLHTNPIASVSHPKAMGAGNLYGSSLICPGSIIQDGVSPQGLVSPESRQEDTPGLPRRASQHKSSVLGTGVQSNPSQNA